MYFFSILILADKYMLFCLRKSNYKRGKGKRKMGKKSNIAAATAFGCCVLVSIGLSKTSTDYDVLDKVSDSESVGESIKEKMYNRINSASSDMTYDLKRLNTLMNDNKDTSDDTQEEMERPEYNPLDYVNVDDCDISKVIISKENQVTDSTVDEFIKNLISKEGKFIEKDSKSESQKGDVVNIDYTATEKGQDSPFVNVSDEDRTIGDNLFPDDIDKSLEDRKAGDEFDIEYTYPDDYQDDVYKGKTFQYHIKINSIKDVSLTDDMAMALSNGTEKTADDYRKYIRSYLEYLAMENISNTDLQELCDMASVTEYPEDVLTYDIQKSFIGAMSQAGVTNIEDDEFLSYIKQNGYNDISGFMQDVNKKVKENLEDEMKILAMAKKYDLWLDDNELATEILNKTTGYTNADDYYNDYSKYHAQYVLAKLNLAKEIQKNGKQTTDAG